MKKIKTGDQVIVIAGKDKGRKGQVLRILGEKILVEGVNQVKCHQKPNPMRGVEGGVITKSMPLSISNVAIFNPETQKADRVGIKVEVIDGKVVRSRFFKSTGAAVGV